MGGMGVSVGGVASIGIAAGAGINMPLAAPPQAPAAASAGSGPPATAPDFVVAISNAAMQALALDAVTAMDGAGSPQLTTDLAALALLAILEQDQRQKDAMVTAAAAIAAYKTVQTLG